MKVAGVVCAICGVRMDSEKKPDGGLAEGVEAVCMHPHVIGFKEIECGGILELGQIFTGCGVKANDDLWGLSRMALVGGVLEVLVETGTVGGKCGGDGEGGRFFCCFFC